MGGTISLLDSLDPSYKKGGASMLADPRLANHVVVTVPIKSKVSLSCEECMYKTNGLPWKIAKRRMCDQKRKRHRIDHNDNPVEALIADLAEDTKQKTDVGKGPNPIQNSDLEIANSKTTGEENTMKGNEIRPGDELVAEVEYPTHKFWPSPICPRRPYQPCHAHHALSRSRAGQ